MKLPKEFCKSKEVISPSINQGFSLAEFVQSLGINYETYRSAKRLGNYPRTDETVAIAKALNTTVEYLVTGEFPKSDAELRELKKKLSSEGLFNEEHKKPIPTIPQRIAVLSAKQGAALQDVLRTIKGRFPAARIIIFPIPVQGKGAFIKIIETLKGIDQLNFSTILLVRGGGSIEDLWNFNEEALVRCIYELKTPIITGVGHETDFTLVDFVSDLRCATPTAAAVAATPHVDELTESVVHKKVQLQTLLTRRLEIERQHLNHLRSHYFFKDPHRLIENDLLKMMQYKNKLDAFHDKFMISHQSIIKKKLQTLSYLMNQTMAKEQFSYMKKVEKLDLVSPLKTLARGYALVKKDDKLVDSVNMLSKGDKVELTLKDGHVEAEIK